MFYWFMLLLVAVVITLLVSPIRIWIDYRHRGKTEDTLLVKVGMLWELIGFSIQVPVITTSIRGVEVQAEAGRKRKQIALNLTSLKDAGNKLQALKALWRPVRKFLGFFRRAITIQGFVWHTEVGMWDCARLAQFCGTLWAVKGMVGAGLQSFFRFGKKPVFRVLPQFNRNHFRTVLTCIMEFPLGYAIIASFFALYLALKLKLIKRGGEIVRTSNSRADEDSHGEHQGDGRRQYSNR